MDLYKKFKEEPVSKVIQFIQSVGDNFDTYKLTNADDKTAVEGAVERVDGRGYILIAYLNNFLMENRRSVHTSRAIATAIKYDLDREFSQLVQFHGNYDDPSPILAAISRENTKYFRRLTHGARFYKTMSKMNSENSKLVYGYIVKNKLVSETIYNIYDRRNNLQFVRTYVNYMSTHEHARSIMMDFALEHKVPAVFEKCDFSEKTYAWPNFFNSNYDSSLDNDTTTCMHLLYRQNKDIQNDSQMFPTLSLATRGKYPRNVIKFLLDWHVENEVPIGVDHNHSWPIHDTAKYALSGATSEMIQYAMRIGDLEMIDASNFFGETALTKSLESPTYLNTKMLLNHGVTISATTNEHNLYKFLLKRCCIHSSPVSTLKLLKKHKPVEAETILVDRDMRGMSEPLRIKYHHVLDLTDAEMVSKFVTKVRADVMQNNYSTEELTCAIFGDLVYPEYDIIIEPHKLLECRGLIRQMRQSFTSQTPQCAVVHHYWGPLSESFDNMLMTLPMDIREGIFIDVMYNVTEIINFSDMGVIDKQILTALTSFLSYIFVDEQHYNDFIQHTQYRDLDVLTFARHTRDQYIERILKPYISALPPIGDDGDSVSHILSFIYLGKYWQRRLKLFVGDDPKQVLMSIIKQTTTNPRNYGVKRLKQGCKMSEAQKLADRMYV